jgi:hypothetical protein
MLLALLCSVCPSGLTTAISGAPSTAHCQCSAGYGHTGNNQCSVCPAGTYSTGVPTVNATGSALPCLACPGRKTSNPGATDVSQCICPAGGLCHRMQQHAAAWMRQRLSAEMAARLALRAVESSASAWLRFRLLLQQFMNTVVSGGSS